MQKGILGGSADKNNTYKIIIHIPPVGGHRRLFIRRHQKRKTQKTHKRKSHTKRKARRSLKKRRSMKQKQKQKHKKTRHPHK